MILGLGTPAFNVRGEGYASFLVLSTGSSYMADRNGQKAMSSKI